MGSVFVKFRGRLDLEHQLLAGLQALLRGCGHDGRDVAVPGGRAFLLVFQDGIDPFLDLRGVGLFKAAGPILLEAVLCEALGTDLGRGRLGQADDAILAADLAADLIGRVGADKALDIDADAGSWKTSTALRLHFGSLICTDLKFSPSSQRQMSTSWTRLFLMVLCVRCVRMAS